jgi:hypothetical protein
MADKYPPPEDYDTGGPSRETFDRYPADRRLRTFGFRIHSRPKDGPPVWDREGRLYSQSEAALWVSRRIKELENKEKL